jgi:hypothetical protein
MAETLEIPVRYKKHDFIFKAHTIRFGYLHHIVVDMDGTAVTIERDEEGSFRALVDAEKAQASKLDAGLIEALVSVLQSL